MAHAGLRALAVMGLFIVLFAGMARSAETDAPPAPARVLVLDVDGVIGVAASAFIERGLKQAAERDAALVVLHMDTPGGLVSATREIIGAILASSVPIAVYVAPSGARAASAGTYILYAAHIAAMAPGTHLGAATPVSLGGPSGLPGGREPERQPPAEEKRPSAEPATAEERKAVNDAVAYLRSLAEIRGRNPDFAEQAVRTAATMTAPEALKANVIDVIANSLHDLLTAVDGRKVVVNDGSRMLRTQGAAIERLSPDWRTRLIGVITDPNIAYLLLIIGFYGILFEIWNPGFAFPGVIGGICLIIALAALAVMPVSYAGLGLILLGITLMMAEAFIPGMGALGIGGIIAFIAGSVLLFDPGEVPFEFRVAWPVIAVTTAATAAFFLFVIGYALKARRQPVITGAEQLVGGTARILDWSGLAGHVHVHGETWAARADPSLPSGSMFAPGATVRIVALEGLTLVVAPAKPEPLAPPRR